MKVPAGQTETSRVSVTKEGGPTSPGTNTGVPFVIVDVLGDGLVDGPVLLPLRRF